MGGHSFPTWTVIGQVFVLRVFLSEELGTSALIVFAASFESEPNAILSHARQSQKTNAGIAHIVLKNGVAFKCMPFKLEHAGAGVYLAGVLAVVSGRSLSIVPLSIAASSRLGFPVAASH